MADAFAWLGLRLRPLLRSWSWSWSWSWSSWLRSSVSAVQVLFMVMLTAMAMMAPVAIAHAAEPPDLDEHVNRLTNELRCLVCQNQTIADSHSELAVQLKNEVRQQLARGATDDQVRQFMVERYGDFVLYRPPVNAATMLLWGGPALLLLLGVGLFALHWRERRKAFQNMPDSVLPQDEGST